MHRLGTALVLCAAAAVAQAPPKLEFEVASVKPSPPAAATEVHVGIHMDGAQFSANFYALKDYIRMAYKVKQYQVEGPEWINSERYDITAKLPSGSTRDQVPDMLRSLLEDRFKLTSHMGSKEFPVYALVVGKNGTKLKPVADASGPDDGKMPFGVQAQGSANGVSINIGDGSFFSLTPGKLEVKKLTFVQIADVLSRFVDLPIVDMTNLPGKYDITIPVSQDDYYLLLLRSAISAGVSLPPGVAPPEAAGAGETLISGMEKEGLHLEHRKAPLDMVIVDHAEKNPTAN